MNEQDLKEGMVVILKKKHPCGSSRWQIVRNGADVKIKCCGCGHILMLPRVKLKKMIKEYEPAESEKE